MSWLFGESKRDKNVPKQGTILILDIESGSVAAGLVRISQKNPPKLFAETRVHIPILKTRDALVLAKEVGRATEEALAHVSLIAARIRTNNKLAGVGEVTRASVFLGTPWSDLALGRNPGWNHEPVLVARIQKTLSAFFGDMPTSFHAFGTAAIHSLNTLFEPDGHFLLCNINGEVAELLSVQDGALRGRATIPVGTRLLIRTLQSHGGMSAAEAHSALTLARNAPIYTEPLSAAADHFSAAFRESIKNIAEHGQIRGTLIIAPEPAGSWVARTLAEQLKEENNNPFAPGATVRALHAHHLTPHLAAHGPTPDLYLSMEALFVDNHFNRIY